MSRIRNRLFVLLLVGLMTWCGGCATTTRAPEAVSASTAREAPIFDGRSGAPMTWAAMLEQLDAADIIVVGEQHDDAFGHAVQLAVVEDVLDRAGAAAICLEMLERDEQHLVDDYFDGVIDAETFAKLTFSTDWAGEGTWAVWFQPIVDATRNGGGVLIAANAPRRYVRMARTDGYEALDEIPPPRQGLFDRPDELLEGPYRDRFYDLMGGMHGDNAPDSAWLDSMFRSQLVWDTTMAASTVRGRALTGGKAVLLIGQFHSDHEGGTVQQIRAMAPDARVLVISMQRANGESLRDEDRDAADVVVYTGER